MSPAIAGLALMAKAAAWYAADRGSIPLTGTNHVEVSKRPKEPGCKPGERSSSQVRLHAFCTKHALVAQVEERLVEAQEVGVSKSPRCTTVLMLKIFSGLAQRQSYRLLGGQMQVRILQPEPITGGCF